MENLPMLRHYKNGNGWEFLVLTKEDNDKIQDSLKKINEKIFSESMLFAKNLLSVFSKKPTTNQLLQVAVALFNKRTIASYTAYQEYMKYLCAVSGKKKEEENK